MVRDVLFISHANPEDNAFAQWLALRLAVEGYAVWCDVTQLLGGEDFWIEIETAIRERAVKFLFVLTEHSNRKPGTLNELALARTVARSLKLEDFILPLHLDDLRHGETNIELHRLNAIPFDTGWAGGLGRLLAKLEKDGVPKHPAFGPGAVAAWWRSRRNVDAGVVVDRSEPYLSNWFPIGDLPGEIRLHHLARYGGGTTEVGDLPYPAVKHGSYLISFAVAEELEPAISQPTYLVSSTSCPLDAFLAGACPEPLVERREARNVLTNLLRQAWWLEMDRRGLPTYELSGQARCFYFAHGMVEQDKVHFLGAQGQRTWRQLVGTATVGRGEAREPITRFWHFGLQLRPLLYPVRAYSATPHVLFSHDGRTIWDSKAALHRARRRQCKQWWNDVWRDRMLAAVAWLADGEGALVLPLGASATIRVAARPLEFTSPVSLVDPDQADDPVDADLDLDDEDGEDEPGAEEVA